MKLLYNGAASQLKWKISQVTSALNVSELAVPPGPCILQARSTGRHHLHFLRGSKSLWILFHGSQMNQFFVFSSVPILMEGQYLLHFGSTGWIKIWKGRPSIVLQQPERATCTMREVCSCVTWNFSLGPRVAGTRQKNLIAIPVSRELISAVTPGSQGKQFKYNSLPMTAPEGTSLSKHGSIFLCVVLFQQQSKDYINAV